MGSCESLPPQPLAQSLAWSTHLVHVQLMTRMESPGLTSDLSTRLNLKDFRYFLEIECLPH